MVSDYLFNLQPVWFFCVALLVSVWVRRRYPLLCYFLWIIVLVKLLLPFGMIEKTIHHKSIFQWYVLCRDALPYPSFLNDASETAIPEGKSAKDQDKAKIHQKMRDSLGIFSSPSDNRFLYTNKLTDLSHNPFWDRIPFYAVMLWLSVSLGLLFFRIRAYRKLWKVVRTWPEINEGYAYDYLLQYAREMELKTIPILKDAPKPFIVPFAIGFLTRNIVVALPHSIIESKNIKKLQVFLCHELMHIKKKDHYVNAIRFFGFVLFHIHPLRWIADRFITGFQEITTDLKAIDILKIPRKEYIDILMSNFWELNTRDKLMKSPAYFLEGEESFVRRLYYIKKYNSDKTTMSKATAVCLSLFVVVVSLVSLSLYASNPERESIDLGTATPFYTFPEPVKTFPPIYHQFGATPLFHNDLLWVLELLYGLYVYRWDEEIGPQLLTSYTFQETGSMEQPEVTRDVAFWGDYAYLAVSNYNRNFENCRVDILRLTGDNELVKVGEIAHNYPTQIEVIGNTLWISGAGDFIDEGMISLYDLSTPESPQYLESDYFDNIPATLGSFNEGRTPYIMVDSVVFLFGDSSSLSSMEIVRFPYQINYVTQINASTLFAYTVDMQSIGSSDSYLCILEKGNGGFETTNITRLWNSKVSDSLFSAGLYNIDQSVLIPLANPKVCAVVKYTDHRLELSMFSKENSPIFCTLYKDRLISMQPEIMVYDINDFIPPASKVLVWDQQ